MSDIGGGCVVLLVIGVVVYALWGIHTSGEKAAHRHFVDCRKRLAVDSAALLRYRPECQKWTLPPQELP